MDKQLAYPKKIVVKKPAISTLDRMLSKVVKAMDGGKCFICGKPGTQAAHIFSKKAHPGARYWAGLNVRWTCFGCHKGSKYSMHENPEWFRDWYCNKYGQKQYDALKLSVNLAGKLDLNMEKMGLKIVLEELARQDLTGNDGFHSPWAPNAGVKIRNLYGWS